MNVLITGGAGFIGSHVVENLLKDKRIKRISIIDNLLDGSLKNLKDSLHDQRVFFYKKDINNINNIKYLFKKINTVIHLAALSDIVPSIVHPTQYLNTNIMGTVNVLEAMRSYNVPKIIYAASSSCYGIPKKYPTSESGKIDPQYPYAFSKYTGEQVILHWSKVYGINFISLRLFNVYGLRSRTHGAYGAALGVFLKQKLSKKPFTVVGTGNQKRDFVNAKDVAEAFKKSIFLKKKNLILNIGSSNPKSVNYLLSLIKGKKIYIPKRPGEPQMTFANILMAKKKLNWRPLISLNIGINEVLENINYWKNAPLWNSIKIYKATKIWFKYLSKKKKLNKIY
jgi:UDP-glucose 4-epimerase